MNIREERHRQYRIISVLIVDDHPLFRDGLSKAIELEDDIRVVGQCSDGEEALRAAQRLQPDVVLLDVNLPTLNGLQVTRQLKIERSQVAVVVVTAYHDSQQVLHAMRTGASAYCSKDITPDELIAVIRDVADGLYIVGDERLSERDMKTWVSANVEAAAGPYALDPEDHFVPLSPREMEILQFVVRGLSNKEIAKVLRISHQTVKNHMTSILKKLNVQDRTQAAVTALRYGWVRIQDTDSESTR
ncbi:MAG: response regulator transcription factor [Anaerolineae bacterium]|nr:response regulator transcription factor [Anaerolineae bacterium]